MKRQRSPEPQSSGKRVKLQPEEMAISIRTGNRRARRFLRRKGLASGFRRVPKAVKSYVHRTIQSAEETKVVFGLEHYGRLGGNTTYVWTPSWQIAQGASSNQRVGRRIANVSVLANVTWVHNGEGSGPGFINRAEESVLRMLVVRSRAIKAAGVTSPNLQANPAGMLVSNILRWSAQPYQVITSSVETRTWTVLKDIRLKSARENNEGLNDYTTRQAFRRVRIPIGKICNYVSGDAFGYFSGAETYIVFICGWVGTINGTDATAVATDNVGTIQVTGEIMFKDA